MDFKLDGETWEHAFETITDNDLIDLACKSFYKLQQ